MPKKQICRLDAVEIQRGAIFYGKGCTAAYVDDELQFVSHPNPIEIKAPDACIIWAADMKKRNVEILNTIETIKEVETIADMPF